MSELSSGTTINTYKFDKSHHKPKNPNNSFTVCPLNEHENAMHSSSQACVFRTFIYHIRKESPSRHKTAFKYSMKKDVAEKA